MSVNNSLALARLICGRVGNPWVSAILTWLVNRASKLLSRYCVCLFILFFCLAEIKMDHGKSEYERHSGLHRALDKPDDVLHYSISLKACFSWQYWPQVISPFRYFATASASRIVIPWAISAAVRMLLKLVFLAPARASVRLQLIRFSMQRIIVIGCCWWCQRSAWSFQACSMLRSGRDLDAKRKYRFEDWYCLCGSRRRCVLPYQRLRVRRMSLVCVLGD